MSFTSKISKEPLHFMPAASSISVCTWSFEDCSVPTSLAAITYTAFPFSIPGQYHNSNSNNDAGGASQIHQPQQQQRGRSSSGESVSQADQRPILSLLDHHLLARKHESRAKCGISSDAPCRSTLMISQSTSPKVSSTSSCETRHTTRMAEAAARNQVQAELNQRERNREVREIEEGLATGRHERLRRAGFADAPGDDNDSSITTTSSDDRRSRHSRRANPGNKRDKRAKRKERRKSKDKHRARRDRRDPSPWGSDSSTLSDDDSPAPRRRDARRDKRSERRQGHGGKNIADNRGRRSGHDRRDSSVESNDGRDRKSRKNFKPEMVGFFDPYCADGDREMSMVGNHRLYHSIHLFLQSARD